MTLRPITGVHVEICSTDEPKPNNRAVLKVFGPKPFNEVPLEEYDLGDFASLIQQLRRLELEHNYGLDPQSRTFKSKMRSLRKALGFTYP